MTIRFHRNDLPDLSRYRVAAVAIDTETLGLNPHRDRLCVVQLSPGDGTADVIQIAPGQRAAPNLGSLLGDCAGLVRLNRADEMPGQGEVGETGLFLQGLLQIVLAEIAQAGAIGFANGLGRLGLADRQQADRIRIAPRSLRRLTDARSDLCNILCYRGHYLRSISPAV